MIQRNNALSTEVLSLPESALTRGKYEFSPDEDSWIIPDASKRKYFNFDSLRTKCDSELILSLKKTLLWYLKSRSVSHAGNMLYYFKHMVENVVREGEVLQSISIHHIKSYRTALKENEYYLGSLSGFLSKWHRMGYPGIEANTYALLKKLPFKSNRKGWAVLTFDPEVGPFVETELQAIHGAVNTAYANGEISNREFSLIWLFMATGARPVQVAGLKVKDFFVRLGDKGQAEYLVNMPRAKQRNVLFRKLFTPRQITACVGEVLETWVAQIKLDYDKNISDGLTSAELPMFPKWNSDNQPGFEHHSNGDELSKEMRKVLSDLNVQSYRTGEKMDIYPQRFRYTLGTRTAMEKAGPLVIAEVLDHSDSQNVEVYVKCVPEILENLNIELANELAPFASAFAGVVVADDSQTGHSNDPSRLIRHPRLDPAKGGVGRCGTGCGGCGAAVPVACYVCPYFKAWMDAPHEEVLADLVEERQRILEETSDERVAFANDNIILAVTQVVQKCKEMKEAANG